MLRERHAHVHMHARIRECRPRERSLLARLHVFQAHRLHLYQRLHQAGWSHAKVSFIYMFATGVLAFAMLFGGLNWLFSLSVSVLLVGVWLDQRVAVPFSLASRAEDD